MTEETPPTPTRPLSPDSHGSLFHHKSWPEPWMHPEFPPNESRGDRETRFLKKGLVGVRASQDILKRYAFRDRAWPWGYFIYRTTYECDEDWTAALAKLDRYFDYQTRHGKDDSLELLPGQLDTGKLVREGYRNVIIEDPELDNVGAEVIIKKHRDWVTRHDLDGYASTRFGHCLMIDKQCLQSILSCRELGSPAMLCDGWTGPHGYINILDVEDHDPEDHNPYL